MPHPSQHAPSHSTNAMLQERLQTLNRTTSAEASALAEQGRRATTATFIFAPFFAFVRVYFGRGQWRHGRSGLIAAILAAYGVFLSYTKLWEQQNVKTTVPPTSQS